MTPLSARPDNDLLMLLKQDGRAAFDAIYDRYWNILFNAAYKRVRDREQCKDAVQNVFIDLWTRRAEINVLNLGAYLQQAVRFQVFRSAVQHTKESSFLDDFAALLASPLHADDLIREKDILHLLELWLQTLPERRRQIFTLRYKEGRSTKEIAEQLNISQNTVQAQLYTATESLRTRLAQVLVVYFIFQFISHH